MKLEEGVTVWDGNKKYKGECPDFVAEKLGLLKKSVRTDKKESADK